MREDLLDHLRVFYAGYDFHLLATRATSADVDIEDPLKKPRPTDS
jgi:hypothetical protein